MFDDLILQVDGRDILWLSYSHSQQDSKEQVYNLEKKRITSRQKNKYEKPDNRIIMAN